MNTDQRQLLAAHVQHWLYNDSAPSTVTVGNRVFELIYDGNRYMITENDAVVGWNDNHKDFRNIAEWI